MKNNSILIISNNETVGKQIISKIKLLRDCDTIKSVSFVESISVLNTTQPSLIIVYCGKSDSIGIIKEIRAIKSLNQVPIIFVSDSFVEDILLYAFDNGIDDFFFLDEEDSIILIRIFLTLQKAILYKQIETNKNILINADIIEKETGLYTKENAYIALRNFFSKSIEDNLENTNFLYIKPVANDNKKLNLQDISIKIKSVLRADDIIAYGKNSGLYIILYNTNISGVKAVVKKLKKQLEQICKIYATATQITTSFEETEPIVLQCLKDQISAGKEFNYIYELTLNEAVENLEIKDENGKNFKDFQKQFFSAFEKIVLPVFEEIKSTHSNSEIKYNLSEEQSSFSFSNNKTTSEIILTYPTYIKLIIDIKHYIDINTPTIRRLTLDFEDFSSDKLKSILNDVINENLNINKEQNKQNME